MLGFWALGQFALGQAGAGQVYAVSVAEIIAIIDQQDASVVGAAMFTVSGPGVEAIFPNGGISIPSEDVSFPYQVVQRTA